MSVVVHLIALFLLQGTSTARSKPTPVQPALLVPSVQVLQVPAFPFMGSAQCDKYGYMYFRVGNDYSTTDILRLSPDARDGTRFKLSGEFANNTNFANYSVTPGGEVYVFAGLRDKWGPLLFPFNNNGEASSPVKLELPEYVDDDNIMAFDGGALSFSGHFDEIAPKSLRGQPYVAMIDPSGKIRMRLSSLPVSTLDVSSSKSREGAGAIAEDSNLYFVTTREVIVISQSGQIVRRIDFTKPDPKSTATGIHVSAGFAAIVLAIPLPDVERGVKLAYLVIDTVSGERLGYYELPEDLRFARDVCFSRTEGFTFMGPDNGQMKLITAPLR